MNTEVATAEVFRSLIEACPLAVFDLDTEGRVKSIWNDAAEDMFGWGKAEVLGDRLPIVPEDKQEEFDKLRDRVLSGEAFSGIEVERIRKDGSPIDVSISTAPIRDRSGEAVSIMSFVEEITVRKELEGSLRESEKKFREIFNSANDAIYLHELTEEGMPGEFLEVNEVASEMLGYDREELLSMSPDRIDAGKEAEKIPQIMEKMVSEGQTTFEMTHQAKDGTEIPVEISSRIFEFGGEKRVLSIARDISERKEAERQLKESRERLEAAMEAGSLAWWRMELPSGKVIFSDMKAEMLGYPPERFEEYSDFTDLLHPDDYEKAMQAMRDHLEGETEKYEVEYRIRKKDGSYKWFRDIGSVTELRDEYRVVTGVVIDIDRRKAAELALEEQKEKLKELHDAVDRFQQCQKEENLCTSAVGVSQQIFNFDFCLFYCAEGDELIPVASTEGVDPRSATPQKLDEGIAGKTFQEGRSVRGGNLQEEGKATTDRSDLVSYISVPVGDVGVFQVASKKAGAFGKDDLELAEILAGHLHEEVKRIRLEEKLREQAIRDPLTDLYNRRYFNETLSKEVERSERYGHHISFLMIDVNRFKEINDRYSHQTGDEVLREVACLLQANVRDADTVVRYGGDEFLVMMPETNGESKYTVDRLREELTDWNRESDLLDFPLSLAFGISSWNPDQNRGIEEALKEADRTMYEYKRNSSDSG